MSIPVKRCICSTDSNGEILSSLAPSPFVDIACLTNKACGNVRHSEWFTSYTRLAQIIYVSYRDEYCLAHLQNVDKHYNRFLVLIAITLASWRVGLAVNLLSSFLNMAHFKEGASNWQMCYVNFSDADIISQAQMNESLLAYLFKFWAVVVTGWTR